MLENFMCTFQGYLSRRQCAIDHDRGQFPLHSAFTFSLVYRALHSLHRCSTMYFALDIITESLVTYKLNATTLDEWKLNAVTPRRRWASND